MTTRQAQTSKRTGRAALALLLCLSAAACVNTNDAELTGGDDSSADSSGAGSGGDSETTTEQAANAEFTISNIVEGAGTGGAVTLSVYMDAAKTKPTGAGLNQFCTTETCGCSFVWDQINETSGFAETYQREVYMPLNVVPTSSLAQCNAPEVYTNGEIRDGTSIKVKVIANSSNANTLKVTAYRIVKGGNAVDASFRDEEGRAFVNIHRYSCFERNRRGMTIASKTHKYTNSTTSEEVTAPYATNFCITLANGTKVGGDEGCENAADIADSAQSYYYNLFVPSTRLGNINLSNSRYYCPKVYETLNLRTPGSGKTQRNEYIGGPDYWPKDTSFALAVKGSPEWSVGVVAPSVLGKPGIPDSASSECTSGDSENPDGDGGDGGGDGGGGGGGGVTGKEISNRCVGFARKPNSDGSCPYFRDGEGRIRMTYRLRRFVAVYPPTFDTNGKVIEQPVAADIAYVIDRPVKSPNPLKPYTMYGPKPCNFAYFDHSGVSDLPLTAGYGTGYNLPSYGAGTKFGIRRPGWVATNANGDAAFSGASWNNRNVDGIFFPNIDDASAPSCSTAFPIPAYGNNDPSLPGQVVALSLGTSHVSNNGFIRVGNGITISMNNVYVRPTNSWHPFYVEDTEFEACAPLASPFKDPPLHFAKGENGNVSWCAMAYPTQFENLDNVDRRRGASSEEAVIGYVRPFTSPVIKGVRPAAKVQNVSLAASACSPTKLAYASGTAGCSGVYKQGYHCAGLSGEVVDAYGPATYDATVTCDRTISVGPDYPKHSPLQAPPRAIEYMLHKDPSYNCAVSFDENGVRSTNKWSPSSGCCGRADDGNPIFEDLASTPVADINGNPVAGGDPGDGAGGLNTGHLEAFPALFDKLEGVSPCTMPDY